MIPEAPFIFSVAALSVSLAGFTGLIAALRRGSEWRPIDLFRVREIVEFGFVSALLALLFTPVVATVHDVSRAVAIVCGVAAMYLIIATFILRRRQRALQLAVSLDWYVPAAIVSTLAFISALAGLATGEVVWLLWTLLFMLGRPMLAFGFVLVLLHRDAR